MARPLFARIASLTLAACLTAAAWAGDAEPSFIPVKEAALGVWAAQPFTELKKAKMVADLDATRMLAERLYGSVLSSTEISRDKLAVSQIIETGLAFQSRLTGLAPPANGLMPTAGIQSNWQSAGSRRCRSSAKKSTNAARP